MFTAYKKRAGCIFVRPCVDCVCEGVDLLTKSFCIQTVTKLLKLNWSWREQTNKQSYT